MDIELYKYDYNKLVNTIMEQFPQVQDRIMLEKILVSFGENINGTYILLRNDYYDDDNSYFNVLRLLETYFDIDGVGNVFRELKNEVNCNNSTYEVKRKLNIK